jgi:biopolymer transport protein ExbB
MANAAPRGTGVLATIGSTAPFVGLFGTVWGVAPFIGVMLVLLIIFMVAAPLATVDIA